MRTIPGTRDDVTSMTPGALREAFSLRRLPRTRRRANDRSAASAAAGRILLDERADLPPVWVALVRLMAFLAVLATIVSGLMAIVVYGLAAVVRGLTGGG